MSFAEKVIWHFSKQFDSKMKCTDCINSCTNLCINSCLNYYHNKPAYECDYLRSAYVLKYFYVNKAEIKSILRDYSQEIHNHLDLNVENETVNLVGASVGAGPGSDFIGLIEWLRTSQITRNNKLDLTFYRIDKEHNWLNQYKEIVDIYKPLMNDCNIHVKFKRKICDAFSSSFNLKKKIDIATISYVISEQIDYDNLKLSTMQVKAATLWNNLKQYLKQNSVLLFNDRTEGIVEECQKYIGDLVMRDYPNSEYHLKQSYGWCEESYPDEIVRKYQPRLNCRSSQNIVFLRKD